MTEQQAYTAVATFPGFELRRYPAHVVAEVAVSGTFAKAGNSAFRHLVRYISGDNRSSTALSMTAPVLQEEMPAPAERGASEKLAMTAPVVQRAAGPQTYVLGFVLPDSVTIETAPVPTDPAVSLREVPSRLSAVRRYSGRWTEASYDEHLTQLRAAIEDAGLVATGEPRFSRFNPPSMPWFLRRNEIEQDVQDAA